MGAKLAVQPPTSEKADDDRQHDVESNRAVGADSLEALHPGALLFLICATYHGLGIAVNQALPPVDFAVSIVAGVTLRLLFQELARRLRVLLASSCATVPPCAGLSPASSLCATTPAMHRPVTSTGDLARLERHLARSIARAITAFHMLDDGDRVMVAVSGGKDSLALMHFLASLARRSPISFQILGVHIDQGIPGHDPSPLVVFLRENGHEVRVEHDNIYSIVRAKTPPGKTYCSMCSRLRRGVLYRMATELGCNKIALGHHGDDTMATLVLNLLFSGQLKAMPPKLVSDDGRHVVIRPLVFCSEDDIARFAAAMRFPILPCNLCGAQANQRRRVVSELLKELEAHVPGARASILAALANVRPSHLLDMRLWRTLGLEVARDDVEPVQGEISPLPRDLCS